MLNIENIWLAKVGMVGAGPWRAFGDFDSASVQVSNLTGNLTLEVSDDRLDITNFYPHGVAISADGIYLIDTGARWIRATGDADATLHARS